MQLECPTCKIVLTERSVGGETVDQCDACNGTWYDASELSSILRNTVGHASPDFPSAAPLSTILCPKCSIEISATIYANDSGIPICKCTSCKGVWLVEGQLEKIAHFKNAPHKTDWHRQWSIRMPKTLGSTDTLNYFNRVSIRSRLPQSFWSLRLWVEDLKACFGCLRICCCRWCASGSRMRWEILREFEWDWLRQRLRKRLLGLQSRSGAGFCCSSALALQSMVQLLGNPGNVRAMKRCERSRTCVWFGNG